MYKISGNRNYFKSLFREYTAIQTPLQFMCFLLGKADEYLYKGCSQSSQNSAI